MQFQHQVQHQGIPINAHREPSVIERLKERLSFAASVAERLTQAMNFIDGQDPTPSPPSRATEGFVETYDASLEAVLGQIDAQVRRLERIVGQ